MRRGQGHCPTPRRRVLLCEVRERRAGYKKVIATVQPGNLRHPLDSLVLLPLGPDTIRRFTPRRSELWSDNHSWPASIVVAWAERQATTRLGIMVQRVLL